MLKISITKIIIIFYLLIISSLIAEVAYAGPAPEVDNNKVNHHPIKVAVSTYLLDINQLNTNDGSYEMWFYLGFNCLPDCSKFNFELMNGKIKSKELLINRTNYQFYKIDAKLNENMDFHYYPFDLHRLDIIIEDKYLNKQELIFKVNPELSGIDKNLTLLGWTEKPYWAAKVINFLYPAYNQDYSRYIFTVSITRPILSGVFKGILPGAIIMIIGFLGLFFDPKEAYRGIQLTGSAVIPMVVTHLNLTESIPSAHYITYIDGFMIANYFSLFIILLLSLVLIKNANSLRLYFLSKLFRIFVPIFWLISQILIVLAFFG